MAQYHEQVRLDPGRESGVWRGADGTYYVMQGDSGSVRPPAAAGPLELVYHSHPTQADAAMQGLVSQPSQAAGDLGVLQYQHGTGPAGRRQSSELHFPVYDAAGNQTGYGATQFAYDPTNPLPLQVRTTTPGGGASTQRYASFADFQARTGIHAGGATAADSAAARASADVRLTQDVAAAQQRVDTTTRALAAGTQGPMGIREGRELGRQIAAEEESGAPMLAGPAYTAAVPGMEPGESMEIPINPAYPSPPGTPAELEALMDQVAVSRAAQSELATTESAMQVQASEQETHQTQLGEADVVAQDLATGRGDHQATVDSTEQTNADQQATSDDALTSLGRSAEEATALTTLVGSLRVFQGLAHLFTYLPGDLGREAEGAKADAGGLIESLNRVSETDTVEAGVETGQQVIEQDAGRITTVSMEGESTDAELTAGEAQITALTDANAQALAETEGVEAQAAAERRDAASSEEDAQSTHDDLLAQLQQWAQDHRQAREDAIANAVSEYEALGYRAEPQP